MMKRYFLYAALAGAFAFTACSKSDDNNSGVRTIKYDFTTTTAADYSIQAKVDSMEYTEAVVGLAWSKTLSVTDGDSAVLTVYPPYNWSGTSNEADVTLKISVDGVEKASEAAHFIGLDRPNGLRITTHL